MKTNTKETIQENEQFIKQAKQYIKAIKENRMFCIIKNVSSSRMSGQIAFFSTERNKNTRSYYQSNYILLFNKLGYKESRNNYGYFIINGGGIGMNFHINNSIVTDLHRLGFISKKQCEKLVQQTPTIL